MAGLSFESFFHLEYLRRQAEIPEEQSQEVSVTIQELEFSRRAPDDRPQRQFGAPKAALARNRSPAQAKSETPYPVMLEAGAALSLAFGAIAVVAFLVGAGISP